MAIQNGFSRAKPVLSNVEGTPRTPSPEVNFFAGPFDVAQDMLCAFARDIPSFGCGSAALGPLRFIRWKSSPVMVLYGKGELFAAIVLTGFGGFVIYEARGLPYHSSVRGLM